MATEQKTITPTKFPTWQQKINPLWWLMNGDTFEAPVENNGVPYLPEVTDPTLRAWYWWWRNPFANFVGFVLGVEDQERTIYGTAPVEEATMWDHGAHGWKWACTSAPISKSWMVVLAVCSFLIGFGGWWWLFPAAVFSLFRATGVLPFLSYSGSKILFYVGWRYSGGFGVKINNGHDVVAA